MKKDATRDDIIDADGLAFGASSAQMRYARLGQYMQFPVVDPWKLICGK
jgi:hypothetical protein